jgi:hypothetical protein
MEFPELFKRQLADTILSSFTKDDVFLNEVAKEAAIRITGEVLHAGNDLAPEVSGLIATKLEKIIRGPLPPNGQPYGLKDKIEHFLRNGTTMVSYV